MTNPATAGLSTSAGLGNSILSWRLPEEIVFPQGTSGIESESSPQEIAEAVDPRGTWSTPPASGIRITGGASSVTSLDFQRDFLARALKAGETGEAGTAPHMSSPITSITLSTRIRLRRIARESRDRGEGSGVAEAVERRAEALLERIWVSSAGRDNLFQNSTFVTITGDGAVQFEWESDTVLIEAIVEPEGGFAIYVHQGDEEAEEYHPEPMAEAVVAIERGWGGARRAAGEI